MYASWHGHLEVVRELLTSAHLWDIGVDVNSKDDRGETALSYASRFGYQDIVRLLKEAGAR
jgi:ankyrin repeat protein